MRPQMSSGNPDCHEEGGCTDGSVAVIEAAAAEAAEAAAAAAAVVEESTKGVPVVVWVAVGAVVVSAGAYFFLM